MQPREMIEVYFRHAWIVFILVTSVNGAVWWYRGRSEMVTNPELVPGYRRLIRAWLIYCNLPWLVMGAGIVFGGVPSVRDYLTPRGGPYVILFYLSVIADWIWIYRWLFFRGGAEELAAHPGLFDRPMEARKIKSFSLVALAGGVAGLLMAFFGVVRIPH